MSARKETSSRKEKLNKLEKLLKVLHKSIADDSPQDFPEPNPDDIVGIPEPVYDEAVQKDVQGNLLPGFNTTYQHFLFFQFHKVSSAKAFLQDIVPFVSSTLEVLQFRRLNRQRRARIGKLQTFMTAAWMNVAFSHSAIAKLTSDAEADTFGDRSFTLGMAERSTYLGDPTATGARGHNSNWKFGGSKNPVDMMLTAASNDLAQLQQFVTLLKELAEDHGVELLYEQDAAMLPDEFRGHEHFGFQDGISQPGVRGKYSNNAGDYITPRYIDPSDERHKFYGKPGQLMVWPGQFLLGEPRQSTENLFQQSAVQNNFPQWAQRGSYVVVRRLRQDVPGFWDFACEAAGALGIDDIEFAARLVGRWPSGAPVMRTPNSELTPLGKNAFANNHFLFDDDTKKTIFADPTYQGDDFDQAKADFLARVCPHFAHVRKVNLRDSVTDLGKPEDNLARMILRRGIPYGPPIVGKCDIKPGDLTKDRGLMFVCYNTNIEDQFEFLQRRWSNSAIQPNQGGHDLIIGQAGSNRTRFIEYPLPDGSTKTIKVKRDFVTPTGGEYFFAPTISALKDVLAA